MSKRQKAGFQPARCPVRGEGHRSGTGDIDTAGQPIVAESRQLDLLGYSPVPHFDGPDIEPTDEIRLTGQLQRVAEIMGDGKRRTLREIADAARCSEASASARLRDLRKPRFGALRVERYKEPGRPGVWLYSVAREGQR